MSDASSPPAPTPSAAGELPKAYRPSDVEPGILSRWNASGAFHAEPANVLSGAKAPYCVLIPPPNVTGALHLGHALNNTIQDILIRAHRMMGDETLWIVGTDHAGIATQAVVERRLRKEGKLKGPLKDAMTREQFVALVQEWKDEYEATITGQLKAMGSSCDYARQRFTMDPICARAVREAFFRLFKDGLIYRGKRLVNWDPVLQTAVADDECFEQEIDANFYYLRYQVVREARDQGSEGSRDQVKSLQPVTWDELAARGYPHARQHPPEQQAWVTVATTRPETYLGDTAVAVNPHDPRAVPLRGLSVELPLVGRVIPIVEDDYVVLPARDSKYWPGSGPAKAASEDRGADEPADPKAQFATGFLKVTPAHDQNDYELGQRHKLPLVNIMGPDGTVSDKHGWADVGDARRFVGMTREDARKHVVETFKKHPVGASEVPVLEDVKPYRHSVKHSDRSKAIVEPYLSDQWYVKVTDPRLAQSANEALVAEQRTSSSLVPTPPSGEGESEEENTLRFHPARYAKTFEHWHDNIRDWCVSRQLWWGHQIPVWSARPGVHPNRNSDAWINWLEDQIEAGNLFTRHRPDVDERDYIADRSLASHFLCFREPPSEEGIRLLGAAGFVQDPDVLDTWFSSALWPLSTLGWPDPDQSPATKGLLEAFNPTSVLSTAREIITLWVSRMVMMNRYLLDGQVPFRDVFIHAVVQDGEGKRMSKSAGNGVDPLDIISSHGADALRFTLCQMTTQTQDVRMPVSRDAATGKNTSPKFDVGRNFCNKLWNAARFALGMLSSNSSPRSLDASLPRSLSLASLPLVDRWMLSRLSSTLTEVNASLKDYQFAGYAQAMYDILWRDFCDWYLEAIKPTVAENADQRAVLAHTLETIVRMLHPVTPFVTEALWEHLREVNTEPIEGFTLAPSRVNGLLATAGWPVLDASLRDEHAERDFGRVQSLINMIREVRAQHQVVTKRRITLHAPGALLSELRASGGLAYVESLAGLDVATASSAAAAPATLTATIRFESFDLVLSNLAEQADAGAEKERLERELADRTKAIGLITKRLENPGYMAKAPAKLVEESKAQLAAFEAEIKVLTEQLEKMG